MAIANLAAVEAVAEVVRNPIVGTGTQCNGTVTGSAKGLSGSSGCVPAPGSNTLQIIAIGEDCVFELFGTTTCSDSVAFTGGGLFNTCFFSEDQNQQIVPFGSFEASCG